MPLTLEEVNLEIRKRKAELLEINESIRKSKITKSHLEHDTAESQEEYNAIREGNKAWDLKLKEVQKECKDIRSKAAGMFADAEFRANEVTRLIKQKEKDLATLDRDKDIASRVKKQFRDNVEKNKELDKELQAVVDKGKELDKLIAKQKDNDSLKIVLEASKKELQETIDSNVKSRMKIEEAMGEAMNDRATLKSEIQRYSISIKENEAATQLLKTKINHKDYEIEELENNKKLDTEKQSQATTNLEEKTRLVNNKEKRLDIILEKLKKNKKLKDDLEELGV